MLRFQLGIDIGGTFTDLVVYDNLTKQVKIYKISTTPKEPEKAVIRAIEEIGINGKEINFINHATTIATNALLTRENLPKTALITNKGFRDILEIGRQKRAELYNLKYTRPPPLIPRKYRFCIKGRIASDGSIIEEIELNKIIKLKKKMKDENINSIAISFLNSYVNKVHEVKVKETLKDEFKYICASHEVDPNYREFERTSTTVLNAILMPIVSDYLLRLKYELEKMEINSKVYVMCSNGGLATYEYASKLPISIIESGPAAGVLACSYFSKVLGKDKIITFDMGGTTAKVGIVINGKPDIANEYEVAGKVHSGRVIKGSGYPVRYPFIDLAEVSAGGGTIAWIDEGGSLRVGPRSAGAEPGPVAYNKGGQEPTVTDANIVLGKLNSDFLLGGKMKIFGELSKKVIEDKIAKKLNMNVITASEGIIRIINNIMAKSISIMSIERGRDPREFSIIAFGGAGPMHACELADEIGIKEIIVPPHPGLFSAYGLLTVDIVKVFSSSVFDKDLDKVLIELKNNAIEDFKKEGFENVEFEEFIDVRYKGQSYEITLKYEGKPNIREQFDKEHKKLYGYSSKDPIEIVSVKVLAIAKIPKIEIAESRRNKDKIEIISKRKVYFNGESYEIPIYSRNAIDVGFEGKGPAIIEEYDSTIVINPNWKWFVDKYLNIILSR